VDAKSQRAYVPTTTLAKTVDFDEDMMHVLLTDGRRVSVPLVGSHEFYVRDKKLGGLQLTLKPNETYYLKVNVDEGHARIKFRGVSVVPEGEGGFAIKQIQPIKKGDIYDKNLVDPNVISH
jgi:hypothetical protein